MTNAVTRQGPGAPRQSEEGTDGAELSDAGMREEGTVSETSSDEKIPPAPTEPADQDAAERVDGEPQRRLQEVH